MEKRGIIAPGWTPPEEDENGVKKAGDDCLENHPTTRFSDAASKALETPGSLGSPSSPKLEMS